MKASFLALSALVWAGPAFAGPCRPSKPSSASSTVAAVSSAPSLTSSLALNTQIVSTPPSSVPVSSSPAAVSSAPAAPSSSPAPSTLSSAFVSASSSSSASAALPSSSGGVATCSTGNLFKDADLSLGLSYWPSDILTGSPTCQLSTSCGASTAGTAYAACLELDLVTLGAAEGIDFHQSVAVTKGTSYTGSFYYRLPALGASGKSMATLTCTVNGATKYSVVLCADDVTQTWKKVSFDYTADCTDAEFMCKVTTSAVTAQLQFADFYLGAQC